MRATFPSNLILGFDHTNNIYKKAQIMKFPTFLSLS
jgi:hypothetical protein